MSTTLHLALLFSALILYLQVQVQGKIRIVRIKEQKSRETKKVVKQGREPPIPAVNIHSCTCLFPFFVTELWLLNPRVATKLPHYKKEWHQVFLCVNARSNNQLHTEKVRWWPLCSISSYALLITEHYKCARNFYLNLVTVESAGIKPEGSQYVRPNNQSHYKKMRWPLCFICSLLHSVTGK